MTALVTLLATSAVNAATASGSGGSPSVGAISAAAQPNTSTPHTSSTTASATTTTGSASFNGEHSYLTPTMSVPTASVQPSNLNGGWQQANGSGMMDWAQADHINRAASLRAQTNQSHQPMGTSY